MHNTCFELIESERYNKNNPRHIEIMARLNTKDISFDELSAYLAKRCSTNYHISDEEIAQIFSNRNNMILAAENEQCDIINNYMADIQHGTN